MAPLIGQTISHYRILEKLGEGGMGVVYKAEDLKLTRKVALKFLPRGLDADEPERARFLQEARAAAILNHPNICTIHDIAEHDGQQFIVMEFVEGKTLREIVPVKKLQDAIMYAIQIAEALQEAHTKGIVHRDIKAENIMVNSKNQAKVMDFGLAKLKGSLKLTKTSSTIGTLAYMAPEQIQGEEVDTRSDLFSFGIVLYEMLTGHMPFRGDHEAAMVYSIVNEEPEPLQHYLPDAPSELLHILERALEKDREERYQTAHDMLIDLRRLRKDSSRVVRQPGTGIPGGRRAVEVPEGEAKKARKNLLLAGVAALAVLGVVAIAFVMLRTTGVQLNPHRTSMTLRVPFREITYHALSRDGNWVAFPARGEDGTWDVYMMNTGGGTPRRITEEHSLRRMSVDLSPDMSLLAYDFWNEQAATYWKVKIVESQGGTARTVAEVGAGGKWMPDGARLTYLRPGDVSMSGGAGRMEVWSIRPDGTDRRLEFVDSITAGGAWAFSWSPDGGSIAWVRNWPEGYGEVMVRDLATGKEWQLTSDKKSVDEVVWTTNDMILFVSNRTGPSNLWVLPAGGGEPTSITQGGASVLTSRISADNKTLVYLQQEVVVHTWISAIDGSAARQITASDGASYSTEFSPDGRLIAFLSGEGDAVALTESHLFVMNRDGEDQRQLTFGHERVDGAAWSPDGSWLAYCSRGVGEPEDSSRIYLIQPLKPGPPVFLCKGVFAGWLDSENLVVFSQMKTLRYSRKGDLLGQVHEDSTWVIPLESKTTMIVRDFRGARRGLWSVSVDASGKATGQPTLLLPRNVVAVAPRDMRFFVYRSGENELWRVWSTTGTKERVGKALPGESFLFDVSADGKEILWGRLSNPSKLVLVKNVFE